MTMDINLQARIIPVGYVSRHTRGWYALTWDFFNERFMRESAYSQRTAIELARLQVRLLKREYFRKQADDKGPKYFDFDEWDGGDLDD